jgi:methionyl aminopeptidase
VRPGVTTWELNEIADREMKRLGANSAFLGYKPSGAPAYPAVLCTSVNDVVVHGIPRKDVVLKEGDIVGVDFGCFLDGFCGDSARTVMVGKVSDEARRLVEATRDALDRAISHCLPGNRLQDIGWAVESYVKERGYSVVTNFVGHGIGRAMHEDPPVPNYGTPGRGIRLKPGLVLAIEPMVNEGMSAVKILPDRWTAVTEDGSLSAHFEHSVAITKDGPLVLSRR